MNRTHNNRGSDSYKRQIVRDRYSHSFHQLYLWMFWFLVSERNEIVYFVYNEMYTHVFIQGICAYIKNEMPNWRDLIWCVSVLIVVIVAAGLHFLFFLYFQQETDT